MKRTFLSFLTTLSLLILWSPCSALAQNRSNAAGHWEGSVDARGIKLIVNLDLAQKENSAWHGTMTMLAQGIKDAALGSLTVDSSAITFNASGGAGELAFKGKLSEDSQIISGEMTQSGRTYPFKLERKASSKSAQTAASQSPDKGVPGQGLEGNWQGTLDAGGMSLRLMVKAVKAADGTFTGKLDSPDQGVMELPLANVTLKDKAVRFEIGMVGGVYEGTLNQDGSEISGQWQQGGVSLPLTFKRRASNPNAAPSTKQP